MPLIRSRSEKAFKRNFREELKAGRSKKQALAIAYSQQKLARGLKSKRKR